MAIRFSDCDLTNPQQWQNEDKKQLLISEILQKNESRAKSEFWILRGIPGFMLKTQNLNLENYFIINTNVIEWFRYHHVDATD